MGSQIETKESADVTRTLLQVLAIVAMMVACGWILSPFLLAGAWATTIVVATWPVMLRVQELFGGRRGAAVAVMTLALLVILMLPLSAGVAAVIDNGPRIGAWLKSATTAAIPPPPEWLETVPLVGKRVVTYWQSLANATSDEIAARHAPQARFVLEWFIAQIGSFGRMLVQFLLTVVIAGILYATGESAARGVERFAIRLAGERGEDAVHLAGQAIRAVALGVVVTAIVQSALGGIGLAVAGVPFAMVLTLVMFFLGVCQIGPLPVLLSALVWLYYWRGDAFWGTVLLVWAVPVGLLDNFLRPMLIRRGANLSMLLILPGVIGGLVAFGIIGLFVGPVVLAVTYTLLSEWIQPVERERVRV
jgi:predicted PurR-regulated permease PerM